MCMGAIRKALGTGAVAQQQAAAVQQQQTILPAADAAPTRQSGAQVKSSGDNSSVSVYSSSPNGTKRKKATTVPGLNL